MMQTTWWTKTTKHDRPHPKQRGNGSHRLVTITCFCLLWLSSSNTLALDKGTTIIGTKEAPNVLNVVPWQDEEFSGDPWKIQPYPTDSVLDSSQKSLDKDVLRREVEYFNLLRHETDATQ